MIKIHINLLNLLLRLQDPFQLSYPLFSTPELILQTRLNPFNLLTHHLRHFFQLKVLFFQLLASSSLICQLLLHSLDQLNQLSILVFRNVSLRSQLLSLCLQCVTLFLNLSQLCLSRSHGLVQPFVL